MRHELSTDTRHRCKTNNTPETLLTQYVDALRLGDVARFKGIEAESRDWWFASLDRGAGAALHFAADHGQVTTSTSCKAETLDKRICKCME